jgi:hypothetical protein
MLELKIDLLRLNVQGRAGQEPRLEGIAERVAGLLADRLAESSAGLPRRPAGTEIENLEAPGVPIDLDGISDEDAAERLAEALADVIRIEAGF